MKMLADPEAEVFFSLLSDQLVEILPKAPDCPQNLRSFFVFPSSDQEQPRPLVECRSRSILLESRRHICP